MKTPGNALFVVLAVLCISSVGCIERATDTQITTACENLLKIIPTSSEEVAQQRIDCERDLKREKISAQAAQCRAEAENVDEFWNRCR